MENVDRLTARRGRFVILRHELPSASSIASHWDFMLENGDLLLTFRLLELPPETGWPPAAINYEWPVRRDGWLLERLADHRLVYLDYQGQLSGDRGSVEQLARGEYHQLAAPAGEQCVQLTSDTLRARIRFIPCGVAQFTPFEFSHWQFFPPAPNHSKD